jgi:RNA polymerase sigma factor (sigma-70 family)
MQSKPDAKLLRQYAELGDEAAFTEIVSRHTDLVYSIALRHMDSREVACDVAQNVFTSLAQGAHTLWRKLDANSSLAGWLSRCTRNISLNFRRDEFRRLSRETQAMKHLDPTPDAALHWDQLHSLLDQAMSELNDTDHEALVLRYFENHDLLTVGRALNVSDDTAQKRVSRALEKLRAHLAGRGLKTTTDVLSIVISANAVQAAPVGLVVKLATGALGAAALPNSVGMAVTKTIAMTMMQKTLIGTALVAAIAAGVYEARRASQLSDQVQGVQELRRGLSADNEELKRERAEMSRQLTELRGEVERLSRNVPELLKLRAEVSRLKSVDKSGSKVDSTEAAMTSWLNRVKEFKRLPERMPDKAIPELRLLNEEDWLELAKSPLEHDAKEVNLEDDKVARLVFSAVRAKAKDKLMRVFSRALEGYADANSGQLPTDPSQLQPYLMNSHFLGPARVVDIPESAVDQDIFLRYEILQTGTLKEVPEDATILAERTPVDSEYDTCLRVGKFWMGVSGIDAYSPETHAKHE